MSRDRRAARAIKTGVAGMRNFSSGRPDSIMVRVEGQRGDRYIVRRDHWSSAILAPVVPAGAEVPWPCQAELVFEDGNRQRGFLSYPFAPRSAPRPEEEVPDIEITGWPTFRRDWQRTNCVDSLYEPGEPESVERPLALSRGTDEQVIEIEGDTRVNLFGGALPPWTLVVDGADVTEQPQNWRDFSIWDSGILTMETDLSEFFDFWFDPVAWDPELAFWATGETQYETTRKLNVGGSALWEYQAPIREVVYSGGSSGGGGGVD